MNFKSIWFTWVLGILLLCVHSSQVNAQNTTQETISVKLNNVTIVDIFSELKEKTSYNFLYGQFIIDNNQKYSIDYKKKDINFILNDLGKKFNFSFTIKSKDIIISKASKSENNAEAKKVGVIGTIKDNEGQPVPGAYIAEKGTANTSESDMDGNFAINVNPGAVLQISAMGFTAKEIATEGNLNPSVILDFDSKILDEVVVIGYGSQRRELITNAVGKLKVTEDKMRPTLSPAQLLEGRVAGVQVTSASGNLGTSESIRIRGAASLSASNEPLYVIDGVPITNPTASIFNFGENLSALATLSLNDIESITILKDAASAAIYGSRATNGVVVITTKQGKEGKSQMNVNYSTGFSQFANPDKIKFSDSKLYLEVLNEGIDNYNQQYGYEVGDSDYVPNQQNPFEGMPDTDWLDVITQTGVFQNIDLSFSGGNKKTNFYLGGNYTNKEGVIKTNKIEKLNLRLNLNHEMYSWLNVGGSFSGNYLKNFRVPGANLGSTIIGRAVEQRPYDRVYQPNGEYYVGGTNQLLRHNPVQILNEETAYVDNLRFLGNVYAQVKFNDKLSWKTTFNTDMLYTYDYVYYNQDHPYGTGVGRLVEYNRLLSNNLMENILTYDTSLFTDLNMSLMGGHSFQKIKNTNSMIDARGFPSPSFDVISVASEIYGASGNNSEYAMESYFGRATFSYLDKYILNASLRTDGSSKFSKENRWDTFPSVSVGWNLSKENFLSNSDTDLKFRMSYGQTGNQEGIGYYAYQPLISGGYNYGGESGIAVGSFGNEDLTWEKTNQFDVGFDVGLWNGKVNFMVDYYKKDTKDLLYSTPIQSTSGTTSILRNVGSLENKGFEFTINTHFNLGKVVWNSEFNISSNKNKITNLNNESGAIPIGSNKALEVGKEIGSWYIFEVEGLYQYDGEVPQEQYDLGVRAGDVKYRDVDGNNIINDNDRVVKGSPTPDFYGGWNNSFKYKGFQLDIFTTFMSGNDVYAAWKQTATGRVGFTSASLEDIVSNRWTGPGTSNEIPRSIWGLNSNNARNSDMWLEDGSFIRLRTVTLSYNFKQGFLGLNGLRIYAQGDNLLLLTKYSGWDPEVNSNLDPQFTGIDSFSVPQPKTFSIGANITL